MRYWERLEDVITYLVFQRSNYLYPVLVGAAEMPILLEYSRVPGCHLVHLVEIFPQIYVGRPSVSKTVELCLQIRRPGE